MGAKYDVDHLVGASEIADRLGLASSSVVRDWRRRHGDFPPPVLVLRMGPIWWWPQVEEWLISSGRLDQQN